MLSEKIGKLNHDELVKYKEDLKRRINKLSTGSAETSLASLGLLSSTGGISTAAASTYNNDDPHATASSSSSSKQQQGEVHWDHLLREMVSFILLLCFALHVMVTVSGRCTNMTHIYMILQ